MPVEGDKVYLRGLREVGRPGTIIRTKRGKQVVYWPDMDYWSKHHPDSLELAANVIPQPEGEPEQ